MTFAAAISPVKPMFIAKNKAELAQWRAQNSKTLGFVPTMGALHEGHLSLVKQAQQKCPLTAVSIFVNPTQFAEGEDLNTYPRTLDEDCAKLRSLNIDLLYLPTANGLYPNGPVTDQKAGPAAQGLESDFRPHFFDGVVTVVAKLFDHVRPDIAVFGQKDYQQYQVIREWTESNAPHITIEAGETIRDEAGLALSSRNAYLSDEDLTIARQMNVILNTHHADPDTAKKALITAGFDKVDYIEKRWGRILAAAWVGETRLIDNLPVQ